MNEMLFGVQTEAPANRKFTNGYTLFDWIMRRRSIPSFWARPIDGESAVTAEELAFLHRNACPLLPLFRDFTEAEIAGIDGEPAARRAANALDKLGVERNGHFAVFAEIPDEWCINHNWMIGFETHARKLGFVAGFIGNTDSSLNFNFDRQASHFLDANRHAVFGATQPKIATPTEWKPYAPSSTTPDGIAVWMTGSEEYYGIRVGTVYAKDESVLPLLLKEERK